MTTATAVSMPDEDYLARLRALGSWWCLGSSALEPRLLMQYAPARPSAPVRGGPVTARWLVAAALVWLAPVALTSASQGQGVGHMHTQGPQPGEGLCRLLSRGFTLEEVLIMAPMNLLENAASTPKRENRASQKSQGDQA